MIGFFERHSVAATGFVITGSVASFVDQVTVVLQLVSAIAATLVAIVTAYVQIKRLLRERSNKE